MSLILICSFLFSTITLYVFYHQEIKKNISSDIHFFQFVWLWGINFEIIIKIFIYTILYSLLIYFTQIIGLIFLLLISKFDAHFTFQYHHLNKNGSRNK